MSNDSSASSNGSFFHSNYLPSSYMSLYILCLNTRPSYFIIIMYIITKILLLLPLFIFIVYLGLQQWWKKSSTLSATTTSHSDCFTYHLVTMELIDVFGCIFYFCTFYTNHAILLLVSVIQLTLTWYGQICFHMLMCVERYLAVVHPITYMTLRNEKWIRIRNMIIGCIWVMSFIGAGLMTTDNVTGAFFNLILLFSSLICISFCSLSVLFALLRPGPGERGGGRERVDQSKQRAFYTIVTILGVLVLRLTTNLVSFVIYMFGELDCTMLVSWIWTNVPTSLVLPLLFLHRKGKFMCCRKTKNNNAGGLKH